MNLILSIERALDVTRGHEALVPAIGVVRPPHPRPSISLVDLDHLQLLALAHGYAALAGGCGDLGYNFIRIK